MKSSAKAVLAVGGVLGLALLAAILIIQIDPFHLRIAASNELNWVSLVGAILGVVGTLGGLTVGIISISTLSQVEQRVSDAFSRKYEEHRAQLNEQSNAWATGIRLWTKASMEENLTVVQDLVEQTLEKWPEAPDARTEMVRRLYEETEKSYLFDLIPSQRSSFEIRAAAVGRNIYRTLIPALPESYLVDAAHWWTLAWERERPGNEGYLAYVGSKLAAQQDRLKDMLKYVAIWKRGGSAKGKWDHLVWAWCVHSEQGMRSLEDILECGVGRASNDIVTQLRNVTGVAAAATRYCLTIERTPRLGVSRTIGIARHDDEGWEIVTYSSGNGKQVGSQTVESDQECSEYLAQRYITIDVVPAWPEYPLPPSEYPFSQ